MAEEVCSDSFKSRQ